tara:strand:- start:2550 stop:3221 length:672 start_codon:yes stop_codon:yes gene_type:complete
MSNDTYTPPLRYDALTPLYDTVIRTLTREEVWRAALIEQLDPKPGDRVLDVGCGTGTLALALKRREPDADIIGIDPDAGVLARARLKAHAAGQTINFLDGFLGTTPLPPGWRPNKIVSSLMFHQTPLETKSAILCTMRGLIPDAGEIHVADYGFQETALMRTLFRLTVQSLDGVSDTQPNADGVLPQLMREAGLTVDTTRVIPTLTGSISIFRAVLDRKSMTP